MSHVVGLTPMIYVADLEASCEFLRTCLGFEITTPTEGYAFARRESGALRLLQAPDTAEFAAAFPTVHIYVDVDDVDGFYEAHKTAIEALPPDLCRPPFDRHYGQREFHLWHGPYLFFVGQTISMAGSA